MDEDQRQIAHIVHETATSLSKRVDVADAAVRNVKLLHLRTRGKFMKLSVLLTTLETFSRQP